MDTLNTNPAPVVAAERYLELERSELEFIHQFVNQGDPAVFLQIPQLRWQLAYQRSQRMTRTDLKTLPTYNEGEIAGAVQHNVDQLHRGAAIPRPDLLVNVLRSIECLYREPDMKSVLSVGPRTEAEIMALMAAGYQLGNIRALDLISYSPLVDLGDMHSMPYADQSFDVVVLGWVIGYSKNSQKVADEVARVCKPNAVVAMGCEYAPETLGATSLDAPRYTHTDDFLKLFGDRVKSVFFRHEVRNKMEVGNVMTVFQLN